jgi:ribosome modulation factor
MDQKLCKLPSVKITDEERMATAFELGQKARANHESVDDCPYGYELFADEWLRGFNEKNAELKG